jgi:predicted translin family RNA/ssDNA-binding protein
MDLPGSEGILSAIGGAVASAAASIATMGRRFAKRLATLEKRANELATKVGELSGKVDGLDRLLSAGALRDAIDARVRAVLDKRERLRDSQREVVVDQKEFIRGIAHQVAREEIAASCATCRRELDRLDREVQSVRTLVEGATPGTAFAEHLGAEADRWNEVHRSLGQIEGALTAIRGRMKG